MSDSTEDYWPRTSVVISTYQRPQLLARALRSVLAQDDTDFEVIVVHDGPDDSCDTREVIEYASMKFEDRGIYLNYIELGENSGYQCVPKNIGIHAAHGDYIAFLDDDNEFTPDHISVLAAAMEEGDVWPDFTYGRRTYVRDEGAPDDVVVGDSPLVEWTEQSVQRLGAAARFNFIDTSDVMIARGALWRLHVTTGSMWNESMRRFGDWELMTRGAYYSGWRGKAVDRIVNIYHWTGTNLQLTRPVNETPIPLTAEQYDEIKSLSVHTD